MATFAVTSNTVLSSTPVLVRKLVCTGGQTALAYTHGENRAPDEISSIILTENPTVTTVVAVRTSATQLTFDTLGDAADAIEVYLKWYDQANGGLSTITTT